MIPVHRCETNGDLLTGLDRIVGDDRYPKCAIIPVAPIP